MGVLPCVFRHGQSWQGLNLDGSEEISITGLSDLKPRLEVTMTIKRQDGASEETPLLVRLDTADEVAYYKNGGILHYVLRQLLKSGETAGNA